MLKFVNGVVYAALAAFAFATIAAPLKSAVNAVVRRYSYEPDLVWPGLWLALALLLVALLADLVRRLASGRRVGIARYTLLLACVGVSLGARKELPAPPMVTVTDGLTHAMARVEIAADAAWSKAKTYPADRAGLPVELPEAIRDLGFRARLARTLTTRVVVVPDALEPQLVAGPDSAPGDVVFAVDRSRTRYWVTAFTLDARGRVVPASDADGRILMGSGADGQPRSRLDPGFPEYPHKLPLRAPAGSPGGP